MTPTEINTAIITGIVFLIITIVLKYFSNKRVRDFFKIKPMDMINTILGLLFGWIGFPTGSFEPLSKVKKNPRRLILEILFVVFVIIAVITAEYFTIRK